MAELNDVSYIKNKEVVKYSMAEVAGHWGLAVMMFIVIITTLLLFRDVIFHVLGIIGGVLVPTPSYFMDIHMIFGGLLIIFGLAVMFVLAGNEKKNILMKNPFKDFKAYGHSVFYFFFMSGHERHGGGGMYYGSQRMVFLALVYTVGLLGLSGVFLLALPENEIIFSIMLLTHVLMTGLGVLIIMYHVGMTIRRHDGTGLKCYYVTGRLPVSYIKKHHKAWYREISAHEKEIAGLKKRHRKKGIKDPVGVAVKKFMELEYGEVTDDFVREMTTKFKKEYKKDELDHMIEISKTID